MSDFVTSNDVFVNQHAESRDEVLRFISQKAVELGITDDADAVYKAFIAREDMGETGMTDGFAVPHAKDAAIKKAAVIVFKNDHALDWPSFDEKPVDIAISLLVPAGEGGLRQDSVAICHQMRALDKQGLIERWGALPPDRLAQIERVVLRTLGVRA